MVKLGPSEPVIGIERHTLRVLVISKDGAVPLDVNEKIIENRPLLLSGDVARWLYIALTGRPIDDLNPSRYNLNYASCARAHIAQRRHRPAYKLADQVIRQWGYHIHPWLGFRAVNTRTRQEVDHPDQWIMVDLFSTEEITIDQQYMVRLYVFQDHQTQPLEKRS